MLKSFRLTRVYLANALGGKQPFWPALRVTREPKNPYSWNLNVAASSYLLIGWRAL